MFCTQCGKKLTDEMLFCPYCGHPNTKQTNTESEPTNDAPMESVSAEEFVPLSEIIGEQEDVTPRVESLFAKWEQEEKEAPAQEKTVQLHGHTPDLHRATERKVGGKHAKSSTFVPEKTVEISDDLFLDEDEEDDFTDPYDKRLNRSRKRDVEEDAETEGNVGNFLSNHLRSLVSLSLMLILLVIIAMWVFSAGGQRALAHIGLATNANAYAELGMEAYNQEAYAVAGRWYEKALEQDDDNYDYAYSAGVSYYKANDADQAEEYFRKAIRIRPNDANAYLFIRALYANAKSIPEDVAALLQTGYLRTGNESLKIQ